MTEDDKALVEQLRDEADTWGEPKHADEIDMRGKLHTAAERIEAQAAEIERLRKPKTVTVTVVSAYDRKAMNTFKINPAEKTYVRPDHSMFGYVFEPEDDAGR
jgi:hypothetical protein